MENYHQGPDHVIPSTNKMTWRLNDSVRLNTEENDILTDPPISVITALKRVAENHPERIAIVNSSDDLKDVYTYKMYYESVVHLAKVLIKLGLKSCHGVAIICSNSAQCIISYMAAIFAGGIAAPIHPSSSEESKKTLINRAECNIVFVDNEIYLENILKIIPSLQHVKAIIVHKGPLISEIANVYQWDDIMKTPVDEFEEDLRNRILEIAPNKCCTLIPTSGSTGMQKSVMLSHDNLIWAIKTLQNFCNEGKYCPPDISVSFKYLCHITSMISDVYWPILCNGGTVYIAKPNSAQESLIQKLKEVRPTFMLGVPQIWESVMEHVLLPNSKTNESKNLAALMGLDRCRLIITGGTPSKRELLDFYINLNIPMMETYALTECGCITINQINNFKKGSVGLPIPGRKIKFEKESDCEGKKISVAGRNVFMGYLKDEPLTRNSFDDEHFMRTGDIGIVDEDNFLTLVGRSTDLIIRKDAVNIHPVPIENRILHLLPCLRHCMVVGEGQDNLHALLVFKIKMNAINGEPTDMLHEDAEKWCNDIGLFVNKLSDLAENKDPKLIEAIDQVIKKANDGASLYFSWVKNWKILPRGFSVNGGELNNTLKMKRKVISEQYKSLIEDLYKN